MTKKEIKEFARQRGFTSHYSGKLKKHFFRATGFGMNIHALINAK